MLNHKMTNHLFIAAIAATTIWGGLYTAAFAAEDTPPTTRPDHWTADKSDCKVLGLTKSPPWTIGVSNFGLGNSFRVQMIEELKAAAARDSRIKEVIITNADGNLAKQLSDIEDLRTRNVDGLLVAPLSPQGLVAPIEEATSDHVPVVVFNDRVDSDKFTAIMWSDEYKFGWLGGNWLRKKLGGKGNIVMLDGTPGTAVNDLRSRGALDAMGPGIKVLARQPAAWAYDKGKAAMEDFISAYPNIDGVYSQGGAMSQGALDALLAAKKALLPIPGEGYNGFLKVWYANQSKGFSAIAPDEPSWQSAAALEVLTNCLAGGTVDKWTELPIPLITDETVAQYALPKCADDVWSNTKLSADDFAKLYHCSK